MKITDIETATSALDKISSQLAYDLASGLWPREIVLQKYDLDNADWDRLRNNPRFQEVVAEAYAYWNGKDGAERRIRAKAKVMLEDSMPTLFSLAVNSDVAPSARLGAISQMEKLSGMTTAEVGANTGPKFRIQINLGSQSLDISGDNPNHVPATIDYDAEEYVDDDG